MQTRPIQMLSPCLVVFLCSVLVTFSPSLSDDGDLFGSCGKRPFTCGNRTVEVAYPFNTADSPASCGYPSFQLNCSSSSGSAITIQVGRRTYVVLGDIDYSNNLIALLDQSFFNRPCPLPSEDTDIDSTLFSYTDRDVEVTFFFDCTSFIGPRLLNIGCSSTSPWYFWPNSSWPHREFPCRTVRVQMDSAAVDGMMSDRISYAQALQEGFTVTWKESIEGSCGECINSGGVCGYTNSRHVCFCSNNGSNTEDSCNPQRLNSSKNTGVIIGAAAGVGALAAAILVGVCCYCRRRNGKPEEAQQHANLLAQTTFSIEASPQIIEANPKKAPEIFRRVEEPLKIDSSKNQIFEYEELHEATNGFVSSNELGDGGFGIVYKGHLRDGRAVAIKRLYENSHRRMQQFRTEVTILSSLRHPNLVSLYGSTARDSRELLLVYEYVPNGTIADHLHGARTSSGRGLPWRTRMRIAIETADALSFLHAFKIVHRDVKTDNILLDGDFRVKVADFGLSRLFPPDATHVSTAPQGTPGYVDPEYHRCYRLTDKSDVYSFGVVLAELISSKPAVDVGRQPSDINLFNLAVSRIRNNELEELVDPRLWRQSNGEVIWMIRQVAEVAFRCLQEEREMRPTMTEVLEALRAIDDVGRNGAKWSAAKLDETSPPGSPDSVIAAWESKKTTPNPSA